MKNQRNIYDRKALWGVSHPSTVIQRGMMTVDSIPLGVKSIVEVGAGDGLNVKLMKEKGYDPVAFDLSRSALKHVNVQGRVVGTVSQLPFFNQQFDLVMACEVLEHLPFCIYGESVSEISRVARKNIIVTVPWQENLEWSFARCTACGCIFHGAFHVRKFDKTGLAELFKGFRCKFIKEIVTVRHPDRTINFELFIRHRIAKEYLYVRDSLQCPVCLSAISEKPGRNLAGWLAAAVRFVYRKITAKPVPLWYLALYEREDT